MRGVRAAMVALGAVAIVAPATARAQRTDAAAAPSAILSRVQRMVNGGDRDGARAFADSVVQASPEGSAAYVEALYARAFASPSAVEAERDYLRVSVEYSLSPRAEDATMMVAQLKLARGDRLGARRNFERLVREHPEGSQASKAAFWAGRLAIEDGDLPHGCQSLATSRAKVSADDVELVNQIDYYRQRCSAAALAAAAPADTAAAAASTAKGATTPGAGSAKARPKTAREKAQERADSVRAERARVESARKERVRLEQERVAAERAEKLRVALEQRAAQEQAATQERIAREQAERQRAADSAAAVPGKVFTVQVAAFPKLRDAEALKEVLQQRGYEARVWGAKAPFRVRVGRYATHEEADAALARMKGSRLNGMVVEAEPQ